MSLRLAIFDCDGTLVDSRDAIVAAMSEAANLHGLPQPHPGAVLRVVGLSLFEAVAILFPGTSDELRLELEQAYKRAFSAARARGEVSEPLYPGASASLNNLEEAGWLLGVATGKSHRGLVATLSRHNLLEKFTTLQTADRAPGKPKPDMIYRALEETGVDAAQSVMVGDTSYDMTMAKNAGVRAVGVAWGYHKPHELMDAGAELVIDDCGRLAAAIHVLVD